ncbi:MAG: TlpA family protein disulfide reductase [Desulfobacterales bacterium]|nr:TlpA family protein disulfide reductase [Desulfobacterales bacterium]
MLGYPAVAADAPLKKGDVLPQINLPVPKDPGHKSYLGLSGEGEFKIPQTKAKVIIIEIFSMYCPYCQREAPEINKLYRKIENDPDLKGKIKLIGLGAGNSSFEVDVFRKTYEIPFPLFADEDFSIHNRFGDVRTPYFIGVKIDDGGNHRVFYSKAGGFDGAEQFLALTLRLSGLK